MGKIKVTPAVEEDEVIVAGIGSFSAGGEIESSGALETEPKAVTASESAPESRREVGRASADAYSDPALSGLDAEPMPLAQKIVIVAAIVCIIGAIAFYLIAMR